MTTDALPADSRAPLGRPEVLAMLARYGDRAPEQVDEVVGSLELTWLIAEAEQHYGLRIDLDDEQFARIRTVDDAVAVLREVLAPGAAAP
ncbi:acyl carrier protein [Kitasatospora terrestris]|uniref:Carrier domain-containing protein n=1 Tax=Kitasatospora terrestris TaxID=258051 RepID=A0ABP9ECV4_9ACTN